MELGDQRRADEDQDRAQNDRAKHAVHQHALLRGRRHAEVGEQHQEDEDVVHRQRFFHQIAGQEFRGDAGGVRLGQGAAQVEPQAGIEDQRQADPDRTPDNGFALANAMGSAGAHDPQVYGQGDDDEDGEARPHQGCTD